MPSEPTTPTAKMLWALTPAGAEQTLALKRDVLAIEAQAREQGAAAERERLRRVGPDRLSAAFAVMPAPYRQATWSSGGTGETEPPPDARWEDVFPIQQLVDTLLVALLADPEGA